MTAGDLIRNGMCTSACIVAATTPSRCSCPCAGEHHGALINADVTALLEARRAGLQHLTDLEVISA